MTTTGCCGVKKQKLSGLNSHSGIGPSSSVYSHANSHSDHRNNGYRSREEEEAMDEDGADRGHQYHSPNSALVARGPKKRGNKVVCHEMLIFCFDVLDHFLNGLDCPKNPKFPNDQFPLFVTWKMGKERKLRGCIGTFNCTSLHHGLREYAITSACKDSRFDPISPDEFSRLHCSVSLLMDFEMAEDYLDWEIGMHGIRIEFNNEKGSKKAATYLPEVAVEQGWNQIQTIDSLLRKGGYRGSITPDIRASVCVIRFQSDKLTVSFAEYDAHKRMSNGHAHSPHSSNQSNGHLASGSNGHTNGYSTRKHGRFFPSLGGNHHHRYPTRGSDHRTANPPSPTPAHPPNHHPPTQASRYLPLLNQPYPPHRQL